ncbi:MULTISPECIES: hypothetical protein [unclassified Bradyrhizobium]|uniref:hypothetical protein n=1 Tax=unclassified Bradyrhizobium TaxID=2631580 RepID=UPI0023068D37|nr:MULTISPECIES: hypothetical protein [unclassified Bradyrhizobium]
MFELIAVCDECHGRLHRDKREEPADDTPGPAWLEDPYPCDGCRFASEHKNQPWCFILDVSAEDALAPDGNCGPLRHNFEPLK